MDSFISGRIKFYHYIMKKNVATIYCTTILFLSMIGSSWFFLFYQSINNRITTTQVSITSMQTDINLITKITDKIAEVTEQKNKNEKVLQKRLLGISLEAYLSSITEKLASQHIKTTKCTIKEHTNTTGYKSYSVTWQLEGKGEQFDNLLSFFKQEQVLSIDAVTIEFNNKKNLFTVLITSLIYLKK